MTKEQPRNKRPISLTQLEDLIRAEAIPKGKSSEAKQLFRQSIDWPSWIHTIALRLGVLFLLAGVVFFFAANWKAMSPMLRLGLLQGGIGIAALLAAWKGATTTIGRAMLMTASMLTGVLLAVYGQIYQTGADAFEIYALWSVLILAWVWLAKSLGLWTLWLVVTQTAFCLFGGQVLVPDDVVGWEAVFIGLAAINAIALLIWESRSKAAPDSPGWFRAVVTIAALVWASAVPFRWIFDFFHRNNDAWILLGTLGWLALCAGVIIYYKFRQDILPIGLAFTSIAVILVLAFARFILESGSDELAGLLVITIASLGIFGAAATIVIALGKNLSKTKEINS